MGIVYFEVVAFNVAELSQRGGFGLHDRFVLIDDEIWHFGWTVGGIEPLLTAYSGGWKDHDGTFKRYLNDMIKAVTGGG